MDNVNNKEFIPGRGYKGICEFCGYVFFGKADKKYHPACKVAHNNQKAAMRNKDFKELRYFIIKNDEILEEFYLKGNYLFLTKRDLIEKGFKSSIYTSQVKLKDGTIYYVINKYAYTINKENNEVKIELVKILKQK
jgi:hypothetical protein